MRRALACALTISTGCSLALLHTPDRPPADGKVECITIPIVGDGIGLAASVAATYFSWKNLEHYEGPPLEGAAARWVPLIAMMVFAGSGIDGIVEHYRCTKMQERVGRKENDGSAAPSLPRTEDDEAQRKSAVRHQQDVQRAQEEAEAKQRRSDAQALLKQARDAASAGDCAAVADLGAKIEALDPEIKSAWFDRDVQIAVCTQPSAPPAPAQGL